MNCVPALNLFLSFGFLSFEFVSCFVLRISDLNHCVSGLASFRRATWGLPLSGRSVHCWFIQRHGICPGPAVLQPPGFHCLFRGFKQRRDLFCRKKSDGWFLSWQVNYLYCKNIIIETFQFMKYPVAKLCSPMGAIPGCSRIRDLR